MSTESEDTLRRFVIRARRVQAHSLAQDSDQLRRFASAETKVIISMGGQLTTRRVLPENEEIFESLAARLRPMILQSEPIYYAKVMDAIKEGCPSLSAADVAQIDALTSEWQRTESQEYCDQAYSVQNMSMDGTSATDPLTDVVLALGWLYGDVVHADPKGTKSDAFQFPIQERYAAAVRVFSHLAELALITLALITHMHDDGLLTVDSSAWIVSVKGGAVEPVVSARAYLAPLGSPMPDPRNPVLPSEFRALTVTELLRQCYSNRVDVRLQDEVGAITALFEGARLRYEKSDEAILWDIVIDDAFVFKFIFDTIINDSLTLCSFTWNIFNSTNGLWLKAIRIFLDLTRAASAEFVVDGDDFFSINTPTLSDNDRQRLEVLAETVDDIVRIERITGEPLKPCLGCFTDLERVQLRQARLMWEGQIVQSVRQPISISSPTGRAPQIIVVNPSNIDVGGAEVPTPKRYLRHPQMYMSEDAEGDEFGGRVFVASAPEGCRFLSWYPDKLTVTSDDMLTATAPWSLIAVDEANFPY